MSLRDERIKKGLDQWELAHISGVSLSLISKLERKCKDINTSSLGTLLKLANALGCTIDKLLTNQELINKLK